MSWWNSVSSWNPWECKCASRATSAKFIKKKKWEAHDQLKQHYTATKMTAFLACTSTHKDTNSKHKLCSVRADVKLTLWPTHTKTVPLPNHKAAPRVTQHCVEWKHRPPGESWGLQVTVSITNYKSFSQIPTKMFRVDLVLELFISKYQKLSRTRTGILVHPCFSLFCIMYL